ncbi:hypothetical protein BBO99_00005436 [Phytophthora kernoviae]|uniref:Uncharacterized protein n=2 Tax=Phytophthora kernoviae TaxID=325452 RepID=A0A3R7G152_9STRA|nr:hypothetical protein G195_006128 [Phytophthora kernoviae 00238/432]KAG2521473.1 hypothetical protein JM16_006242 [Phytophthora kernoviae]KAG2525328.1 hypothetical protein JM18_004937 [Phytophthora kernoviae]RLN20877.1 hypothetical protein BBI17_005529 [Phytophthora kernoviae]RLN79212.1 hypothetical protein BBO99_00005436 [Phytophthora kernoviae]
MKSWVPQLLAFAFVAFSTPTASAGKSTVHGDLLASSKEWPSLQFQFKLKRNSMKIHGESEFDMFANPVVSSDGVDVRYDGFAEFTEDSTSHKYTLVDGVAYYSSGSEADQTDQTSSSTVQCLEADSLPPLNDIVSALNDATVASNVSTPDGVIKCSPGNLFKISFGGGTYALCASGSSGANIYGSDLDVAIKYLNRSVEISAPKMDADAKSECEIVVNGGYLIPHNSPENDGMVEFQSCAGGIPMTNFGSNYRDQFYVTHLNHADTTFYNGDALFKVYKKPVKWFECVL